MPYGCRHEEAHADLTELTKLKDAKMKRLLILLPVLALAACGDGTHTLSQDEATMAELGAVKYSQALDAKYVSCSGIDSNKDNYTTCTIQRASSPTEEIVCSYKAVGCKKK
jgi:hypothetical protein